MKLDKWNACVLLEDRYTIEYGTHSLKLVGSSHQPPLYLFGMCCVSRKEIDVKPVSMTEIV